MTPSETLELAFFSEAIKKEINPLICASGRGTELISRLVTRFPEYLFNDFTMGDIVEISYSKKLMTYGTTVSEVKRFYVPGNMSFSKEVAQKELELHQKEYPWAEFTLTPEIPGTSYVFLSWKPRGKTQSEIFLEQFSRNNYNHERGHTFWLRSSVPENVIELLKKRFPERDFVVSGQREDPTSDEIKIEWITR